MLKRVEIQEVNLLTKGSGITCSAGYTQPVFLMSNLSDSAHEETNYEENISSYIICLSFTAVAQSRTFTSFIGCFCLYY